MGVLQGKGMPVGQLEDDRREVENLQTQAAHDATKIKQLEAALEARDAEINRLTEVSSLQKKGKQKMCSLYKAADSPCITNQDLFCNSLH